VADVDTGADDDTMKCTDLSEWSPVYMCMT